MTRSSCSLTPFQAHHTIQESGALIDPWEDYQTEQEDTFTRGNLDDGSYVIVNLGKSNNARLLSTLLLHHFIR